MALIALLLVNRPCTAIKNHYAVLESRIRKNKIQFALIEDEGGGPEEIYEKEEISPDDEMQDEACVKKQLMLHWKH